MILFVFCLFFYLVSKFMKSLYAVFDTIYKQTQNFETLQKQKFFFKFSYSIFFLQYEHILFFNQFWNRSVFKIVEIYGTVKLRLAFDKLKKKREEKQTEIQSLRKLYNKNYICILKQRWNFKFYFDDICSTQFTYSFHFLC